MRKFFGNLKTVIKHKHRVFKLCCKCGMFWRGLVHDLSKFLPSEFFESVKYYTDGKKSPLATSKINKGYSVAWLTHKGRNKHHPEFWYDPGLTIQPTMPFKYAVEEICDKIAATQIYKGNEYKNSDVYDYWINNTPKDYMANETRAFFDKVFLDLVKYGQNEVLNKNYLEVAYKEVCLSKKLNN